MCVCVFLILTGKLRMNGLPSALSILVVACRGVFGSSYTVVVNGTHSVLFGAYCQCSCYSTSLVQCAIESCHYFCTDELL